VPAHLIEKLAGGPRPAGKVVACLGDSITRGQISANWVDRLQGGHRGDGLAFVNAGVNGDLAWNVLRRLDDVTRLLPDVVVLLVGTNDVNAASSPKEERAYRRRKHLPAEVTLSPDWYAENVTAILGRLREETSARLAVIEIPPAGEDLAAERNQRTQRYNAALRRVAAEQGVPVLPLFGRLAALLPEGHEPPPYRASAGLMTLSAFRHRVLRRSWDQISAANGLTILTDHVHLSDRAAAVVAELVDAFLLT
jgi:lysophospholipase L1-like esterase